MVPYGSHRLAMIASDEGGWEHVSVRVVTENGDRTPSWDTMNYVKNLWWKPTECVLQFHPPQAQYVNNHPNVLHLWRPVDVEIPVPPAMFVGVVDGLRGGGR